MNLELQHSFFPEVSVMANPKYDASGRNDGTTLSATFNMGPTDKDHTVAYAQLRISTVDGECDNEPYRINVTAFALLKNIDDSPVDCTDPNIRRTAVQVLVGSARELISIITSRGPYPGFGIGFIPFSSIRGLNGNTDPQPPKPKVNRKSVKAQKATPAR